MDETNRKDAILHAVAIAGELLLGDQVWTNRVDAVLGHLGEATGVDRVYVFSVDTVSGALTASQRHEWVAPGVEPQIDNPELQDLPFVEAGFGRWAEEMSVGRAVAGDVDSFPAEEQDLLTSQGIVSIVAVPIEVGGRWWGFMGFDATQSRLAWQDAEFDALRAAAGVLGAAIRQESLVAELRASRASFVEAFRREREAADRLRELDDLRNTFLDAVSHELRTPLHTVLGISETLEQHSQRLSAEQQADLLRRLGENGRRLDAILGSLLDLNRLRRGVVAIEPAPVEVSGFVRAVIAGCDALRSLDVRVDVEEGAIAWIDTTIVERVLVNLLENAVVHAIEATTIWVHASCADDRFVLVVEDDGPGVGEEHREEIFEPFAHGYVRRSHAPGTGMGLAIVRRFAGLHGGTATCSDRAGGGASFRVEVLASAEAKPSPVDERGAVG